MFQTLAEVICQGIFSNHIFCKNNAHLYIIIYEHLQISEIEIDIIQLDDYMKQLSAL